MRNQSTTAKRIKANYGGCLVCLPFLPLSSISIYLPLSQEDAHRFFYEEEHFIQFHFMILLTVGRLELAL